MNGQSRAVFGATRHVPEIGLLLAVSAAAWLGVVVVGGNTPTMSGTMGFGLPVFAGLWTLMMAAMMLPSASPFVFLYTRAITDSRGPRSVTLIVGYLLVWSVAALPAYCLAWVADRAVDGRPGIATTLAVGIFAACGMYQLTSLKDRCLSRCRSPLALVFRYTSFRGPTRDLRAGLHLGAYCLGCCWSLMTLLVAFGLMNIAAMVALAVVVMLEKTAPWGAALSRIVGVVGLVLAITAIWTPSLAPGLEHAGHIGGM